MDLIMASVKYKNHWDENVPDDEYHGDRTTVSSSSLRRILKSPAAFRHHLVNREGLKESKALMFGRLVHQVVLDGNHFLQTYAVMPDLKARYGHPNSNVYKAAKADWLAEHEGQTVVTQDEFDAIEGMLSSVLAHRDAYALLKNGIAEVSGYYRDPVTGIRCRIRPDFINTAASVLVDLKTTVDASPEAFARSIWNYRYDFQMGMYSAGYEAIEGKRLQHTAFIAVEKQAPWDVAVYACDEQVLKSGTAGYHAALAKLEQAIKEDRWPGFQERMQTIGLPRWASQDEGASNDRAAAATDDEGPTECDNPYADAESEFGLC